MADKSKENPNPGKQAAKPEAKDKSGKADKASFDPNYKPGPDDAQIDASGARFETDA